MNEYVSVEFILETMAKLLCQIIFHSVSTDGEEGAEGGRANFFLKLFFFFMYVRSPKVKAYKNAVCHEPAKLK